MRQKTMTHPRPFLYIIKVYAHNPPFFFTYKT